VEREVMKKQSSVECDNASDAYIFNWLNCAIYSMKDILLGFMKKIFGCVVKLCIDGLHNGAKKILFKK
jgi:hypothetical protein